VLLPQPSLIIVGGVHVAVALAALARTVGWQTVLIDPRKAWGSRGRFADVDQLMQVWPEEALQQLALNRSSAVVTLTHDPKLDDAALLVALPSRAFYVGALGSASSNEKRRKRLLQAGLNEKEIARLHAPVGLRIGAQTPEEIALAIMAEITSEYRRQGKSPDKTPAPKVNAPSVSPSMPS
jgi:xanthine dehydrogenase accessory factor